MNSTSTDDVLMRLIKEGLIHTRSSGELGPTGANEPRFKFDPVLTVSATDTTFLPLEDDGRMQVQVPSKTVLLKVTDEGIASAGILRGDWVVVQRASQSTQRKIVAAIVRNQFSLRLVGNSGELFRPEGVTPQGVHGATFERRPYRIFGIVLALYRTY